MSFDVKRFFTSVPLDEIIEICTEQLYSLEEPSMRKDNFIRLLKIVTQQVDFSFNNVLYQQVDGIAMGSALRPTLENIFVGYVKYKIIPEFHCKYTRYVDNCFKLCRG